MQCLSELPVSGLILSSCYWNKKMPGLCPLLGVYFFFLINEGSKYFVWYGFPSERYLVNWPITGVWIWSNREPSLWHICFTAGRGKERKGGQEKTIFTYFTSDPLSSPRKDVFRHCKISFVLFPLLKQVWVFQLADLSGTFLISHIIAYILYVWSFVCFLCQLNI